MGFTLPVAKWFTIRAGHQNNVLSTDYCALNAFRVEYEYGGPIDYSDYHHLVEKSSPYVQLDFHIQLWNR